MSKPIILLDLKKYQGQHITRKSAIRLRCLSCCCNQIVEVNQCPARKCPLWGYRMGQKWENPGISDENNDKKRIQVFDLKKYNGQEIPRKSAIRLMCINCYGSYIGVSKCSDKSCPLWGYRIGGKWENPNNHEGL